MQVNCVPEILAGADCIGVAQTGSGKTLAFALPIIQVQYMEIEFLLIYLMHPTNQEVTY